MLATRNLRKTSLKTISNLLNYTTQTTKNNPHFPKNSNLAQNVGIHHKDSIFGTISCRYELGFNGFYCRWMSTSRGRSMRSKVERRMQKESGKTVRQIRQAKKLKLKLMTEEERLIYSLRRAKKKVALLLQKLKKFELPELPPPRHDPELLTTEQLQAFKKIGFRNRNYCPVGVRGVFGGVVQNMHLHWKFHETVQVCCDNFPKEKVKEMATMLARLSGGIVINIHNVKTIIMFRGRNYRQPKNLIPINTLTKRKALFKARFEQALESQKLNIKKIEQQLRKKGISPDDPVAMASIQRVASTFFNAIDKKEGTPYVFRGDEESKRESQKSSGQSEPGEDSDQEELDKFIAEIEDAADKEWAEEEAAEKEELGRIRYWNKEESGGRFRPERYRDNDSNDEIQGGARGWRDTYRRQSQEDDENEDDDSDNEESDGWGANNEDDGSEDEHPTFDSKKDLYKHPPSGVENRKPERSRGPHNNQGFSHKNTGFKGKISEEDSGSEKMFDELDDRMWESDVEEGPTLKPPRTAGSKDHGGSNNRDYYGSSRRDKNIRVDDPDYSEVDIDNSNEDSGNSSFRNGTRKQDKKGRADMVVRTSGADYNRKWIRDGSEPDEILSDSEIAIYESDDDAFDLSALRAVDDDYSGTGGPYKAEDEDNGVDRRKQASQKQNDEIWDSD